MFFLKLNKLLAPTNKDIIYKILNLHYINNFTLLEVANNQEI